MKFDKLKQDEGVAGLTILLSLITMLFVIGLLVMIFSLMGGEISQTSTVLASDTATALQTSVNLTDAGTSLTGCANARNGVLASIVTITNTTGTAVPSNNYTTGTCLVRITSAGIWNSTFANVTYTFTHSGEAFEVINGTTTGISGVTDWYDIFIVIGAMVVLILLTVIIITAIRGSGLMAGGGENRGAGNVGSA